ncbi:hypothetical protein LCGC14_2875210, partial [marine sediment metagenome]
SWGCGAARRFCGGERYYWDFGPCGPGTTWKQYDTNQDAWYFGVWVHPEKRLVLTYAEGDLSLVECPSVETFKAELAAMEKRYGDPPPAAAVERLESELSVIGEMGFESYFLMVWDFVKYAKDNGIAVGPGRGSAAGSIVSYALNITDIDPLAYELMFERFLNPERKSMPDIDIDFSVKGRERVIRYVQDKYGADAVAQIITFGKMAPRAATRDAARVLGCDYAVGDRIAKLIPEPVMGRTPSFDDCIAEGTELRNVYDSDAEVKKIVDVARGLEGIVRNRSTHAAAVVIADKPLVEYVPLGRVQGKEEVITQWAMNDVEAAGLLKMDLLGLGNLTVLAKAVELIEQTTGQLVAQEGELPDSPREALMVMIQGVIQNPVIKMEVLEKLWAME